MPPAMRAGWRRGCRSTSFAARPGPRERQAGLVIWVMPRPMLSCAWWRPAFALSRVHLFDDEIGDERRMNRLCDFCGHFCKFLDECNLLVSPIVDVLSAICIAAHRLPLAVTDFHQCHIQHLAVLAVNFEPSEAFGPVTGLRCLDFLRHDFLLCSRANSMHGTIVPLTHRVKRLCYTVT